MLLSLIADRDAMLQVRESLLPGRGKRISEAKRSYALEVLELRVPNELKALILPLCEALPAALILHKVDRAGTFPPLPPEKRLAALALGDGFLNRWLQISAVQAIGQARTADPDLEDLLRQYQLAPDPVLRETASWSAARLAKTPERKPAGGDKIMLTTIEKVIILKDVSLFAETPDELLAEVAGLLDELEVAAGELVFAKGQVGDSLYIIVSGQVRVHDGDFTVNVLGDSEVFGEMALLDPETRMASVTAASDSLLLRLDQDSFYELMDTRSEVARGIIRVLTARLRLRVQEVAALASTLAVDGD